MILRKVKLIAAAIAAMVLLATPIVARALHKDLTPVDQRHVRTPGHSYDGSAVIGPDGKLLGAASDPSVRSQLQRDGLPN
ncbi:MAG TPA: hypothetical protein VGF53_06525 [Pseudolabrys sp.]